MTTTENPTVKHWWPPGYTSIKLTGEKSQDMVNKIANIRKKKKEATEADRKE